MATARPGPHRIFAIALAALGLAMTGAFSAHAAFGGTPYAPGATLDPQCAPTDTNCTVDFPDGFSTTSALYFLANNTGLAFSSTSAAYFLSTYDRGFFFATTSADYWKTQRDFFSTTSASSFLAQNQSNAFSTTSASYLISTYDKGAFFSTTSAAYFLAQNGGGSSFSTTSAAYFIDASSTIAHAAGGAYGSMLIWNGTAWVSSATSTLGVNLADTAGTLSPAQGGLGMSGFATGDILYADSPTSLARLPHGSNGQVLKVTAGLPAWGIDLTSGTGGSGDGIFATSSGLIYPADTSQTLVIGSNATATPNSVLEVQGQQYISGKLGIGTTSPSSALSVAGNGLVSGNLGVGGTLSAGSISLSSALSPSSGGTGLAFGPSYGQLLVGNASGGYSLLSTSSLGLASRSSFSAGAGIAYDPSTGVISNTGLLSAMGDWAGTFNGLSSASYLANSFSTTSANYYLGTKTTDSLAQGSVNKYYSDALARSSLAAGAGLSYSSTTGTFANTGVLSNTGDWAGTLSGLSGAAYLADSFSTTSANYYLSQNQGSAFSTSSAQYFLSQNGGGSSFSTTSAAYLLSMYDKGYFFSTTSANYYLSQNQGAAFSTSSAAYFLAQNGGGSSFSTTSADYWKTQRDFFSTTSAQYFLSANAGLAFSTTSANYLLSTYDKGSFFSTTSAAYFLAQNQSSAFSTSSANYYLSQNQGASFSTSSAQYFLSQNGGGSSFSSTSALYFLSQNGATAFSTTSSNYWLSTKTTDNVPQGAANKYYSTNLMAADLAATTTDAIAEGTANKYYTDARAKNALAAGAGLSYSTTTGVFANTGVLSNTGDWAGTFNGLSGAAYLANSFSTTSTNYWLGTKTTDSLAQGSANKYYSTALFAADLAATTSLRNLMTLSGLTSAASLSSIGTLTTGSIGSGFGSINIGSNTFTGSGAGLSSLNASNVTSGSLSAGNGGTGLGSVAANGILIGNASGTGWTQVSTSSLGIAASSIVGLNAGAIPGLGSLAALNSVNNANWSGTQLAVSNGGTGATSFNQGWIYSTGGTAALAASTSPTVNYVIATSTTVASNFQLLTIGSPAVLANNPLAIQGSVNNYLQASIQNTSNGNAASSDFVATADNGNDSSYYIDLGINGSAYNQAAYNVGGADSGYLYASDGSLTVGTASTTNAGAALIFHTGGTTAANERMRINSIGNVGIGTSTMQSENSLTLGQTTYSPNYEGGQLDLLPGLKFSASWDIDNYYGNFRILKGVGTGSSTATYMTMSSTTGDATFSGRVIANGGLIGVCNSGSLLGLVSITCSDSAETYPTYEATEPGDVIAIPPAGSQTVNSANGIVEVGKSRGLAGERVLGVVSTDPGLVFDNGSTYLGEENGAFNGPDRAAVALAGRIPVKVSLENGPISAGDELAASPDEPGMAVKAVGAGMSIGVALQSYSSADGLGIGSTTPEIMMFEELRWTPGPGNDGTAGATTTQISAHALCLDSLCLTHDELQSLLQLIHADTESPSPAATPVVQMQPVTQAATTSAPAVYSAPTVPSTGQATTSASDPAPAAAPAVAPSDSSAAPASASVPMPAPAPDPVPAPEADPTPSS